MKMDYVEIKGYLDSDRFSNKKSRKQSDMLSKIEELIDPGQIELFYPKNLFLDDKDLEVYILIGEKILRGTVLDGKVELTVLSLNDLVQFKCEGIIETEGFNRLTLSFINGETIILNSSEDSNPNWQFKFRNEIKALIKRLINKGN